MSPLLLNKHTPEVTTPVVALPLLMYPHSARPEYMWKYFTCDDCVRLHNSFLITLAENLSL